MPTDHHHTVDVPERQGVVLVPQKHDALFDDGLRYLKSSEDIGHFRSERVIEEAGGEHAAQHAMHVIVELLRGNFSSLDRKGCSRSCSHPRAGRASPESASENWACPKGEDRGGEVSRHPAREMAG